MRKIIAFETPDNQRFFNEAEARTHERRYDFGNQIDSAVRSDPQFARLDRGLLIDYFMKHGSTIGKLADSPIMPQEIRGIPAGFSGTLEEKTKRPTTGILPHPSSPEGQRRMAESDARAKQIMDPGRASCRGHGAPRSHGRHGRRTRP